MIARLICKGQFRGGSVTFLNFGRLFLKIEKIKCQTQLPIENRDERMNLTALPFVFAVLGLFVPRLVHLSKSTFSQPLQDIIVLP